MTTRKPHHPTFAVIHARENEEAMKNALLAVECGFNGVFFISHGEMNCDTLINLAHNFQQSIKIKEPLVKVGVNLLDLIGQIGQMPTAINKTQENNLDMLWVDNTPTKEDVQYIKTLKENKENNQWNITLYAGVAFKYQPDEKATKEEIKQTMESLVDVVDVITTSGSATGYAPNIDKIKIFAEIAQNTKQRIAVASGVNKNNVLEMTPYVNEFLVATGVSEDFYNLDKTKCEDLIYQLTYKYAEMDLAKYTKLGR